MKESTTTTEKNKHLETRIEERYFHVQDNCSAAAKEKFAMTRGLNPDKETKKTDHSRTYKEAWR